MRPAPATAARPLLAAALASPSCRYLSNTRNPTTTTQITHRPLFSHNVLRPYHVSIRTLDHRNSAAAVSPPCPPSSDAKAAAAATHDHDHHHHPTHTSADDGHIQPQQKNPIPPNTDPKARMLIGFTCTVCNHRSHKTMSKHAYQHGVVIMQCDHCKNRHLMADHLGWFKTGGVTVEDLVQERGETVRKLTQRYQLVKDGHSSADNNNNNSSNSSSSASSATTIDAEGTTGTAEDVKARAEMTELEIAMEKAAEGMLEWIPKELLEQEQERMKKSQELLDHSKKQD
ncbi:hypothetical protein EC968_003247 [Mortierella alpina]|nr:hypothetical protein EC968_003247 [Mortierella alpina]